MEIMHTIASEVIAQRPKRRFYSPELKTQAVAKCQVSGGSVAGVTQAHGINANIVHRWLHEQAEQQMPVVHNEFVALALTPVAVQKTALASEQADPPYHVRI